MKRDYVKAHTILAAIASVILASCATHDNSKIEPKGERFTLPANYELVWADEFDQNGLPTPNNWSYDTGLNKRGWHNREKQYYSQAKLENSRVENGNLIITARRERLENAPDFGGQNYTSARLVSRGKREFTYGFIEARAKMPCGAGTWPAIWMLGNQGTWPAMGEIDIVEHVGKRPNETSSALHMTAHHSSHPIGAHISVPSACSEFHNYQVLWTPQKIEFFVDGQKFNSYANDGRNNDATWPYHRPQFLILNLAIGGDLGGQVDDTIFPRELLIEYVRVYQIK
ncbi:MAG: licheninase [Hyphomonadaceae bacterium]|nr:MAG: licheninase [Hyphomonadaceae bacterium]KAF0185369.1 MAG: licheninase [Hyphomonadaceae bacterium]